MNSDEEIVVLCVNVGETLRRSFQQDLESDVDPKFVDRGEQAHSVLADHSCDCVLIGADLPDTDLLKFLSRVQSTHPHVPILVSGLTGAQASNVLETGAYDIVSPNTQSDILHNRIRNAVTQYQHRRADSGQNSFLHSLLAYSSDRLSILDADGRYTFVSPAIERVMGYEPEKLLGESGIEYVHPDDQDRVQREFEAIMETPGETRSVEYRFRDADGNWRWVESRGTNRLDDPAIEGIVVSSRDVTDRKTHEDDLREEQALTDAIFAGLPDVFYAFDEHGTFLRWNDRLSEVTGYSDEEIATMQPVEFIVEEDRERVVTSISRVLDNDETVTVEARFETKDGETIPYEFTGAKMTDDDGETLGLVGIGRDISDRKQRQRRFEAVFNNTYQFTGLLEPDGTLLEANETALKFGNLDREEVLGKKVWETYWFQDNTEARQAARDAVEQARNGSFYRTEIEVQGAEGTEIIDFSVRPITDERGDITLLVPEGRAITDLKQRERHLHVLHRFLRHNLRNKMTVIEGTADLLARELGPSSEYARHATQIRETAAELTEQSETAYELSQIAIDADTERRSIDLDGTLESIAAEFREAYPSATLSVQADTGTAVQADWRLRPIFEQLIENAIEHTEQDQPTVTVTVTEADDTATVLIADDGPGIPDDELVGIVTDEEPTQLTHGTGFGLWLVRLVIDDYGGDISYESPSDGGSVLSVTLPVAAGQPDSIDPVDQIEHT